MYRCTKSKLVLQCLFLALALFCSWVVYVNTANAQTSFTVSAGVNLIPNPQFPKPHSSVKVALDDYTLETTGASITWYINGVTQTEYQNERSIQFETGALGKESVVRVILSRTNAPTLSGSVTIVPRTIDLILEANTYVPDFYKGRALPSTESTVRAIAVVNDASVVPDTAYTYKWSQGNTVLFGGAVKGKNVLEVALPHYDNGGLTVEVFGTDGSIIGRETVSLTGVQPEVYFYEHSPLRGLSEKAVVSPLQFIGEEATIYAEPYFMNTSMNEDADTFSWKINGEETAHDTNTPNAITLRHVGGEGEARVGFTMVTKSQIPQFVEKLFQLIF
jgi:hypothetical protein